MSLNEIIEMFTLVSGLEMNEVSGLLPLLTDCKDHFEERMSSDLSESQRRRLAHACAVYAYYRVCLMYGSSRTGFIKAGDLQLEPGSPKELIAAAQRMWDEERSAITGMGDFDDSFAFRSVRA